jgi:hypothetical protein
MANFADIFERLVQPDSGDFSPDLAQYVLSMRFAPDQVTRYEDLASRAQEDKLSAEDRRELEAYVQANAILGMMKAKARRSLVQNTSAA